MVNVKHLVERAELLKRARSFFDAHGFLEVQPPCLCRDVVVDTYLDPLTIPAKQLGLADETLAAQYFLQTSPESAMKRMLAAGAPSIYSIGPVFRSGESGSHHNVEFTMLEWYERGGDAESSIKMLGDFVSEMLGKETQAGPGWERTTYRNVFRESLGIDPFTETIEGLREQVKLHADPTLVSGDTVRRDDLLDILLSERIAPKLGIEKPMIVTDYPLSQAALAKPSATDDQCAARFELFSGGLELANGYDELLDAEVLIERALDNNQKRVESGRSPLEVNTTLAQAMREGLPACSGVALGFDRLLMRMIGTTEIDDVIALTIRNA